jgi:hypothetical protein
MMNLDVVELPDGISVRTAETLFVELANLLKRDGWTMRLAQQAHQTFRPEDFGPATSLEQTVCL